jgi:hypothetical protein
MFCPIYARLTAPLDPSPHREADIPSVRIRSSQQFSFVTAAFQVSPVISICVALVAFVRMLSGLETGLVGCSILGRARSLCIGEGIVSVQRSEIWNGAFGYQAGDARRRRDGTGYKAAKSLMTAFGRAAVKGDGAGVDQESTGRADTCH